MTFRVWLHGSLPCRSAHQTTNQSVVTAAQWLLEGRYTSDTRHHEKPAEKEHRYHKLMDALTLKRFDDKLMIFAFGVGGI